MTVEINYSDEPDAPFVTPENRRRAQLAQILRERTLVDVDCWSTVPRSAATARARSPSRYAAACRRGDQSLTKGVA